MNFFRKIFGYKYLYKASFDSDFFILDIYNSNPIHYVLSPEVFLDFCSYKFTNRDLIKQNSFSDFIKISPEIISDLYKFFSVELNLKVFQIFIYDDFYKRDSYIFKFNNFEDFLKFLNKKFEEIILKNGYSNFSDLVNKKVRFVFMQLKPFEVSGSVFQYFDSMNEFNIEIRSSFGVLQDSTIAYDIHIIDPISFNIIKYETSKQHTMKVIYQNSVVDMDVPYIWQREPKIDTSYIHKILNIFFNIKQILRKPFELYFGIFNKQIFVTSITYEYDSVVDLVEYPKDNLSINIDEKSLQDKVKDSIYLEASEDFLEFFKDKKNKLSERRNKQKNQSRKKAQKNIDLKIKKDNVVNNSDIISRLRSFDSFKTS